MGIDVIKWHILVPSFGSLSYPLRPGCYGSAIFSLTPAIFLKSVSEQLIFMFLAQNLQQEGSTSNTNGLYIVIACCTVFIILTMIAVIAFFWWRRRSSQLARERTMINKCNCSLIYSTDEHDENCNQKAFHGHWFLKKKSTCSRDSPSPYFIENVSVCSSDLLLMCKNLKEYVFLTLLLTC